MKNNYLFDSERLGYRVLCQEDFSDLIEIWGDEEVMKYCGGASNKERIPKSIAFYMNSQVENGYSVYAVIFRDSGEMVGISGFNPGESDNEVELIYHFKKKHWSKGFGEESAKSCIEYIRNNKNIKKITASAATSHAASSKILEKSGFIFIGKEWFDDTNQEENLYQLEL